MLIITGRDVKKDKTKVCKLLELVCDSGEL